MHYGRCVNMGLCSVNCFAWPAVLGKLKKEKLVKRKEDEGKNVKDSAGPHVTVEVQPGS
jgi:hypothetical protein